MRSPSKKERAWLAQQLESAQRFVCEFPELDLERKLTLASLDAAYAQWFSVVDQEDGEAVEEGLHCVGVAFGEFLANGLGMEWVVSTDEWGTELAVVGLKGTADFLIHPLDFVSKRWDEGETHYLESAYVEISEALEDVKAEWASDDSE